MQSHQRTRGAVDLVPQLLARFALELVQLAQAGHARDEHQPRETRVVVQQDPGERQVPDQERVAGQTRIELEAGLARETAHGRPSSTGS